jgi:hypothetical protein
VSNGNRDLPFADLAIVHCQPRFVEFDLCHGFLSFSGNLLNRRTSSDDAIARHEVRRREAEQLELATSPLDDGRGTL